MKPVVNQALLFWLSSVFVSSIASDSPDRTDRRIEALAKLNPGWRYGRGEAIPGEIIDRLKLLKHKAQVLGLTNDVFPDVEGEATLIVYGQDGDFSFQVKKDGRVELDSDSQQLEEAQSLSMDEAFVCLEQLARSPSWNSFFFSISPTTRSTGDAFGALPSATPVTVGSQLSVTTAQSKNQEASVLMPESFTRVSPQNLQSFGGLTRWSSPLTTT